MKSSTVSAIIPCFNRAEKIGWTLRNLLGQTRCPDEIIVVDDGSTDASADVVHSFGDRVQLIQQENQGPGAARNRGLEAASGDYVWFMDSDDLASINHLEVQWRALEASGADLAYGPWIRSHIDESGIKFLGPVLQSDALPPERSMLEWQLGSWSMVFQSCLFRRSTLDGAGRYCTDMRVAEDGEYLVRILTAGAKTVFTPGCLLFYRSEGEDQLTHAKDSASRHAADLTRYYERIGDTLAQRLDEIPIDVVADLALAVYRHNRFCQKNEMQTIRSENAVMKALDHISQARLLTRDIWERAQRRLHRLASSVPDSRGMQCQMPGLKEHKLAASTLLGLSDTIHSQNS
jgi:glycosyltransferase involved in cell wall biosynthesis